MNARRKATPLTRPVTIFRQNLVFLLKNGNANMRSRAAESTRLLKDMWNPSSSGSTRGGNHPARENVFDRPRQENPKMSPNQKLRRCKAKKAKSGKPCQAAASAGGLCFFPR